MKFLQSCHRVISALESLSGWVASACLFAIMVIVFFDVGMRYFLNSPLTWSYDLVSLYLMVALFFLSLSMTQRDRHHVRVDILLNHVSPPARHAMNLVGDSLSAVVMLIILYQGFLKFRSNWLTDGVVAGAIPWPTWLTAVFVPIGVGLLVLRLVFSACSLATALATRSATAIGDVGPEQSLIQAEI